VEVILRTLLAALLTLLACPVHAQQPVEEIPFESVRDFLKLPPDMNFGEVSAVAINSKRHLFVLSRSNISGPAFGALAGQILEFDPTGKYVREVAKGLYNWSFGHGLRIDKDDNIWQVDKGSSTVTKLSPQGRVLMVFGRKGEASSTGSLAPTREPGAPPPAHVDGYFNQPTDVAWDAGGNAYISDGYVNSRVAKVDANGDWVKSWGTRGTGPGEFNTPHSIAVDRTGRVFVADRGNARIQVFDGDGTFLSQFKINVPLPPGARLPIGNTPAAPATTGTNAPGSPFVLCITPGATQYLFAADNWGRIFKMNLDGQVLGVMGKAGKLHGQFGQIHGMACPSENEIYVAEILNWRVQKLLLNPRRTTTNE
jgi:hypothetical protein